MANKRLRDDDDDARRTARARARRNQNELDPEAYEPTDNPMWTSHLRTDRSLFLTKEDMERDLTTEERIEKGIDPNDFVPSKYIYSRSSRSWEFKDTFTAALQVLFHGKPKPIFQYDEIEPEITDITAEEPNFIQKKWFVDVEEGLLQLHPDLQKCNATNSFVFINVSKFHAIVFILKVTGELFTVGFGYYGNRNSNRVQMAKTVVSRGESAAAHLVGKVNVKNGALYSADFLLPSKDHESKIIWCDLFTDEIKAKLLFTLSRTKTIMYNVEQMVDPHSEDSSGNYGPPKFHVTNQAVLEVDTAYFEAAEFIPNIGFNCIKWAKFILGGLHLHCGINGQPYSCKGLKDDQIRNFLFKVYKTDQSMAELTQLIQSLQQYLKPTKSWWTGRGKSRKRKRTKNKRKKRTLKR